MKGKAAKNRYKPIAGARRVVSQVEHSAVTEADIVMIQAAVAKFNINEIKVNANWRFLFLNETIERINERAITIIEIK